MEKYTKEELLNLLNADLDDELLEEVSGGQVGNRCFAEALAEGLSAKEAMLRCNIYSEIELN